MASQCFLLRSADVHEAIFGTVVLERIYPSYLSGEELETIQPLLLASYVFQGYALITISISPKSLKIEQLEYLQEE